MWSKAILCFIILLFFKSDTVFSQSRRKYQSSQDSVLITATNRLLGPFPRLFNRDKNQNSTTHKYYLVKDTINWEMKINLYKMKYKNYELFWVYDSALQMRKKYATPSTHNFPASILLRYYSDSLVCADSVRTGVSSSDVEIYFGTPSKVINLSNDDIEIIYRFDEIWTSNELIFRYKNKKLMLTQFKSDFGYLKLFNLE